MLRSVLSSAARSPSWRRLAENTAVVRPVVNRFVAGAGVEDAIRVCRELAGDRLVSLDHLGEDTLEREQATRTVDAYRTVLRRLGDEGLAARAEVSVKLSALGRALPVDGEKIALENTRLICEAAAAVGTMVTVDMEDHTATDSTLSVVRALRADFPDTGTVLQAYLRRTEADCADFAGPGSRIRLCKGAYDEPGSVAFRRKSEVDASYVRCLRVLMQGKGYPMVATHDSRLIDLAGELAGRTGADFEYQMLYGIRPAVQEQLAAQGRKMRVYVPYGTEWYPYFVRRLAERPANVAFFLRALMNRRGGTR
ncbi:proline dehydrogenase [Amycolatopsis acidicola]|uniref:proline dehydrogenase n=1 Tax=Amycolatopsis acidicola TaxID=2596893 RepID=A0A5N0V6L5_9PSEU|nr:proline dehydrogenase family protein [Amycolatopsis acidicola]KAA9161655.1 proline dehydrogenase [Amycolatopsis acidicola]